MIFRGQLFSKMLEMDTPVTIVAPTNLKKKEGQKIVYLLHGICGDANSWVDYTRLPVYANEHEFIFVLPSAGRSFYTDMRFGQKYFSYVVDELPEICENLLRISTVPEDTIIIGGSMGGYGALKAAFARPEKFGYCCALASGSLFMKEWLEEVQSDKAKARGFYGQMISDLEGMFGSDLAFKEEDDLLAMARKAEKSPIKPKIYMSCGSQDYLLGLNQRFAEEIKKLSYDYTYEEFKGVHDWYFFDKALKKSLEWVSGK